MDECNLSNNHSFEPRYNYSTTIDSGLAESLVKCSLNDNITTILDKCTITSETYLFDICKYCGLKIYPDLGNSK